MNYNFKKLQTAKTLLAVLLVSVSPALLAQPAGPVAPDAGSILRQLQPLTPPAASTSGIKLTIEQTAGARLPAGAPFMVKAIRLIGNPAVDTTTLHALVADGEGKMLTLAQLEKLSDRITDYYRNQGYPLARAIIPAQTIQQGIVTIQIIMARYGKVGLNNSSRVNDRLIKDTLAVLQPGQDIRQAELNRALLLVSDLPGVAVNSTLKPGAEVGTSDLLVNTTLSRTVFGSVVVDGYGSAYTGRARIGGTVNFVDPLKLKIGDILSLTGLSSGNGMNYGRLAYDAVLNGRGTVLGGSYSALSYTLGDSLSALNAHGSAEVQSLWVKHPLLRSRDANLYGQLQYDGLQLRDRIDVTGIHNDRHLKNLTLSLAGDARDDVLSGGINLWNVGMTTGRVDFDDPAAQLSDAVTAKTQGSFSKLNASLVRFQGLNVTDTLYVALSGQWANNNLDSSQKISAGGPYSVRAYNIGAVSGDDGYFATAEYRHILGWAGLGQWQAVAFIDSARVTVNKNTWGAGENTASLNGVGLGLNWTGPDQWSAKAYIARPIGPEPVLAGGQKSTRVWLETRKEF